MTDPSAPLRIMIVDDDPLIRTAFAAQIDAQPPVSVAATAADGLTAVSLLNDGEVTIDVALIDIEMPGLTGPETAQAIMQEHPNMAIVMFTVFHREDSLGDLLSLGVNSVITKDEAPEDVALALVRVYQGEPVMSARPTELLVDAYMTQQAQHEAVRRTQAAVDSMPPHLQAVHAYLLQGLTNKRIALLLDLSQNTVRLYVSEILQQLGYRSRTELLAAHITR